MYRYREKINISPVEKKYERRGKYFKEERPLPDIVHIFLHHNKCKNQGRT